MSEAHDDEIVVTTSSPSVGERLQQAREAKKYSVSEVAAQLRLTKDIVTYMETQQWDKLNGRTYARGYFASYVKFLGLPFDEMLAVFNLEYTASEPSLNLMQRGRSQDEKHFPWFMLALIAIVMLVIWLAFQQWQQTQELQQTSLTDDAEQVETDDTFSPSVVDALDAQPVSSNTPLQSQPTAKTAAELGTSENNLDEITATEAMSTAAGPSQNEQNPAAAESEGPLATEESTLQLSFSGECWLEVTNADSQVLVSKVMRAEQSILLKSDQPLNILLGRSDVATVTFNDQPVDLSPYTEGDVARLTLGAES